MIAPHVPYACAPTWHTTFLAMLPAIRRHARYCFRHVDEEQRDELVQEVIANTLVAFVRLVELGKADLAYPSVLASFAVAQVRAGRRVGRSSNSRDVCSGQAQRKHRFRVESLGRGNGHTSEWQEALADNHRSPVPDAAAFRIDFPQWLNSISERDRKVAESLCFGHSTNEVAQHVGVSAGRISQLRHELHRSWHQFHGEPTV